MKFGAGVYVTSPAVGPMDAAPFFGGAVILSVVGSRFPSRSVSFAVTPIAMGESSVVVTESALTMGASLTELTVMETVSAVAADFTPESAAELVALARYAVHAGRRSLARAMIEQWVKYAGDAGLSDAVRGLREELLQ